MGSSSLRANRSPSTSRMTSSTSACVLNATSGPSASSTPGRKIKNEIKNFTVLSKGRFFHVISARVIYQWLAFSTISSVFCAIDISVYNPNFLLSHFLLYTTHLQHFLIRYKIIAIWAFRSPFRLFFLCKSAKYTSCTVFRLKFIHYGNDVKGFQNSMTIFVRFLFVSLQFTSFFFFVILLS